jgi:hypothetical protein
VPRVPFFDGLRSRRSPGIQVWGGPLNNSYITADPCEGSGPWTGLFHGTRGTIRPWIPAFAGILGGERCARVRTLRSMPGTPV